MAVKSGSWSAMEALVSRGVNQPGETNYAHHKDSAMTVCHHYALNSEVGRKTVVSTAHVRTAGRPFEVKNPPVFAEYASAFSACDKFNKAMHSNWWPFRSANWERHFNDTILGMAFMNVHTLCLEIGLVPQDYSFKQTIGEVGTAIVKKYFKK